MHTRIIYIFLLIFPWIGKAQIVTGAQQVNSYLPLLKDKNVALVVNQTSQIHNTHIVDSLLSLHITIKQLFAPEHGFRGNIDAGAHVNNGKDIKTGLSIISLYGKNKKPTAAQLNQIDVVVFDIQDVGARFYTYISTMHFVMEACAENNVQCIILDRPNPNGMYVQGPVLDPAYSSFVGMHPIPLLHGLTIGELASMINGQGWLKNKVKCNLKIIKMQNYEHRLHYSLKTKPSPNLPNDDAIRLYPSLCLFEGTITSVGRGTSLPFQQYGFPEWTGTYDVNFTPKSIPGASSHPPFENTLCKGNKPDSLVTGFDVSLLINAYSHCSDKNAFFNSPSFFNRLAGNNILIRQIKAGKSKQEIEDSWKPALIEYKTLRKKYLLYP